nr:hypothetical protein CFP56_44556 [Quercus suber]
MGFEISNSHVIIIYEQFGKIGSSHLWLKYFPFENFQGKSGNKLSQIDANGFSQIDIRIEIEGPGLEVMKCEARLVYKQDIEDLKQTIAGSSRCSITPYEYDLDDLEKDTKIKRSRDDFDGDKNGPSGEATNSEVDMVMGSEISDCHGIIFYEQFGKIGSSHLWLKYFPFENFQGKSGNKLSQIDANGFSQIDIRIEIEGPRLEVMKCRARLVYEQDIEDLKQTMARSSRCSIIPYEDDLDDSAKDTKIKPSRVDFDGDENGPSGEATNSEVGIPHPKRIRLPNLIQRFIPHLGNWIGNSSTQEEGDSDCEEEKSQ